MSINARMTGAAGRKYMTLAGLLIIAGALLCVRPAMAQDVKSYTRATFDQWLAKYKDAKPDFKVGDVLTAKDIERMRPFIFPGYLEQLNFPEFKAPIAAPVDHTPRQDYMACTEKYQSQVKLLPDHTVGNYVCGQPFPNSSLKEGDPDSGWKTVWNYEYRWQSFGFSCYAPATWDRFGGTHDVPQWELPPTDWQNSAGWTESNVHPTLPSGDELKMIYGGGGNFQRTLDAFYRKVFLHPPRDAREPYAARARRGELRVQRVHRLLLAL